MRTEPEVEALCKTRRIRRRLTDSAKERKGHLLTPVITELNEWLRSTEPRPPSDVFRELCTIAEDLVQACNLRKRCQRLETKVTTWSDKAKRLESENNDLNAKIAELTRMNAQLTSANREFEAQLVSTALPVGLCQEPESEPEVEQEGLQTRLNDLESQLDAKHLECEALKAELDEARESELRVRADAFDYIRTFAIQPQLTAVSSGAPMIRRRTSSLYPSTQANLSVEDFNADPFFPMESSSEMLEPGYRQQSQHPTPVASFEDNHDPEKWIKFDSSSPPSSPLLPDRMFNASNTSLPLRPNPTPRRLSNSQDPRILRKRTSVSSMSQSQRPFLRTSTTSVSRRPSVKEF